MPMLVLQCLDGTVAGYTCDRNATDGSCLLLSPHCPPPPSHTADGSGSDGNGTSTTNSSHHYTIHHGPYHVPAVPYNRTADTATTSATAFTAQYTSAHPVFNCSRRECGASIMPIVRTCPDGSHAYPLCAWVSERQHCGYLDPSCHYPGRRADPLTSTGQLAAVEVMYVEEGEVGSSGSGSGGGVDGTAAARRQRCERGGCMLPMYVKMCVDGSTVRPHCVWSSMNGTQLCLANEPVCPTAEAAAELHSRLVTTPKNGALLRGVSFAVVGLAAMLSLLAM